MWPVSKRPCVSSVSVGSLGSRNHMTSIGAPKLSLTNPAASRRTDERPSAATTRSALIVSGPSGVFDLHAGNAIAVEYEAGYLGIHPEVEIRIGAALVGKKIQESPIAASAR